MTSGAMTSGVYRCLECHSIEWSGRPVCQRCAQIHALAAERLCRAVEVVSLLDALAHTGGYIRASLTDEDEAFAAHFDGFFERAPVAREEAADADPNVRPPWRSSVTQVNAQPSLFVPKQWQRPLHVWSRSMSDTFQSAEVRVWRGGGKLYWSAVVAACSVYRSIDVAEDREVESLGAAVQAASDWIRRTVLDARGDRQGAEAGTYVLAWLDEIKR